MARFGTWLVALAIFAGLCLGFRGLGTSVEAACTSPAHEACAAAALPRAAPPAQIEPDSATSLPAGSIAGVPGVGPARSPAALILYQHCPQLKTTGEKRHDGERAAGGATNGRTSRGARDGERARGVHRRHGWRTRKREREAGGAPLPSAARPAALCPTPSPPAPPLFTRGPLFLCHPSALTSPTSLPICRPSPRVPSPLSQTPWSTAVAAMQLSSRGGPLGVHFGAPSGPRMARICQRSHPGCELTERTACPLPGALRGAASISPAVSRECRLPGTLTGDAEQLGGDAVDAVNTPFSATGNSGTQTRRTDGIPLVRPVGLARSGNDVTCSLLGFSGAPGPSHDPGRPGSGPGLGPASPRLDPAHVHEVRPTPPARPLPRLCCSASLLCPFALIAVARSCALRRPAARIVPCAALLTDNIAIVSHARRLSLAAARRFLSARRLSGCAQALGDKNGAESGIISEPSITTGAVWMAEGVRSLSRTIKDPLVRVYATPLGKLAHDALALKRPSSSCATTGKQLNGMPSSPASAEPPDSSHLTTLPSAAHLMTPVLGSTIASEPDPQDLHCKIPVGACAVVQNGSSSHVTPGAGAGAGPAIPRLDPAHVYKVHPTPPTRPPPAFAVERCGPGCWCRPVHCNDAIATVSHARRLSCCSICSGRAAQAGLCNDCRAHYRWVAGRDRRTRRQRVTQGAGR